ncbi:ABC transporter permease [Kribbella sp. NPDC048928]|uniref:ABC transporter permease n=1 Tax=Kribbella sp. NPDC048928 TaxID=3364111 RepID=UPI00371E3354
MFIAVRDLRFARGRFVLLGSIIALMTAMVVLLTGLTAGLGAASVSAVAALPVDTLTFQRPASGQEISFATSNLPADTVGAVADAPGVGAAYPLGAATTRLEAGDRSAAVTVLGTDPALYPTLQRGRSPAAGEVVLTNDLSESYSVGDTVVLGGQRVTVTGIVATTSFNHLPVVYTSTSTWQRIARTDGITAVASTGSRPPDTDVRTSVARDAAFAGVGGYSSEQGSLQLMRVLLLVVSALVVGAFFTVWTMQRGADLAVVRAIGASRGYLLRDALAQAGIVLLAGAAVGAAVAAGLGALASRGVPFVLDVRTVGVPLAAVIATGALGAVFSVRRVSTADPLTALGAAR